MMTAITRTLYKRPFNKPAATFVMTFDDEGVADTITRNGKIITSAHREAQQLLRYAENIRDCTGLPPGYTRKA